MLSSSQQGLCEGQQVSWPCSQEDQGAEPRRVSGQKSGRQRVVDLLCSWPFEILLKDLFLIIKQLAKKLSQFLCSDLTTATL